VQWIQQDIVIVLQVQSPPPLRSYSSIVKRQSFDSKWDVQKTLKCDCLEVIDN
jgi:hypothetical protein